MTASAAQRGLIHALAKKIGMTEADRRGLIHAVTGATSTTALTTAQAAAVIDRLKSSGSSASTSAVDGAVKLDGPYAPKIRALWITGHQLGVVRDRTDAAMLAFVERQTGISHTRWLRDAGAARAVIEALKSWIERESGWLYVQASDQDRRISIMRRQWRLLIERGMSVVDVTADIGLCSYAAAVVNRYQLATLATLTAPEADRVIEALRRKIQRQAEGRA